MLCRFRQDNIQCSTQMQMRGTQSWQPVMLVIMPKHPQGLAAVNEQQMVAQCDVGHLPHQSSAGA